MLRIACTIALSSGFDWSVIRPGGAIKCEVLLNHGFSHCYRCDRHPNAQGVIREPTCTPKASGSPASPSGSHLPLVLTLSIAMQDSHILSRSSGYFQYLQLLRFLQVGHSCRENDRLSVLANMTEVGQVGDLSGRI